ncbi:MAG: hydroxyneurosporene-O-methyltransferase, partial [Pseudomonadota bacterium]
MPEHLKPLPDPPALAAEHGLLTLIKARFLRWRDGMLLQRRFQQWALSFPLTRPIARRYAVRLFDLCAGFIYSQVLLAAVRLDLFEMLSEGPLSLADMAKRLRMRTD